MIKWIVALAFVAVASAVSAQQTDSSSNWAYHFQLTAINQSHPSFKAPYSGNNSLLPNSEHALSLTTTLYLGRKLWKNAAIYGNAEISGGSGLSAARGVAGFTNGEAFRIGDPSPAVYLARAYIQQHIALPGAKYVQPDEGPNVVDAAVPDKRISIIIGKFSLSDFYDGNNYSHDPRTQFLNWALMSNGAWDYPANTRGYTSGIITELQLKRFSARLGIVVVPKMANGLDMDFHINKAQSTVAEAAHNWGDKLPGAIRVLAFINNSKAPRYSTTLQQVKAGDSTDVPVYRGEVEGMKYGGKKYGFGINADQQLGTNVGAFARASWNDGKTATWAFTEIDRSVSAGISIFGSLWHRADDNIGIAGVLNGISKDHQNFLNAGLYGFIIGDGRLNYGGERIAEVFYKAQLTQSFAATADYQFVNHPGYNKDRGPAHVFAIRGHVEF